MSTALLVYLCIFIIGFMFMFVSFVFGLDHTVEVGHDMSHPGETNSETMSPSFFSLKVISCFMMGAGLGASACRAWITGPLSTEHSIFMSGYLVDMVFALVGGFLMGWLGWNIIRLLLSQQGGSSYTTQDFLGKRCQLPVSIPANGVGELSCDIKGCTRWLDVRSHNGEMIRACTWVEIIKVDGQVGLVCPVDNIETTNPK